MFNSGDIVKILLPNVVNTGYDYRLDAPADLGAFVECRVMNRPYVGVVWGLGDSGLPAEKIKSVVRVMDSRLSVADLQWIKRMSDWTLMTPGAVLLDVREADEIQSGHIPGAVNLPLSCIGQANLDKSTPIFAYCLRGTRSRQAVAKLSRLGYTKLKSIGGIAGFTGELER